MKVKLGDAVAVFVGERSHGELRWKAVVHEWRKAKGRAKKKGLAIPPKPVSVRYEGVVTKIQEHPVGQGLAEVETIRCWQVGIEVDIKWKKELVVVGKAMKQPRKLEMLP